MRGRRQKSLGARAGESGAKEGFHIHLQASRVRCGGAKTRCLGQFPATLDGFPVTSPTGPDNIFLPLFGPRGPNLSGEHHCSIKDTPVITTFPMMTPPSLCLTALNPDDFTVRFIILVLGSIPVHPTVIYGDQAFKEVVHDRGKFPSALFRQGVSSRGRTSPCANQWAL